MGEFKGTPGPWVYRSRNDSVCMPGKEGWQYGNQIFRFHGDFEEDLPSDADLDLILAAPDLLRALQVAVHALEAQYSEAYSSVSNRRPRIVIAKALGEGQ